MTPLGVDDAFRGRDLLIGHNARNLFTLNQDVSPPDSPGGDQAGVGDRKIDF